MIKVITDNLISDCSQCPLKQSYAKDCGKVVCESIEHGKQYKKVKDNRCKVKVK